MHPSPALVSKWIVASGGLLLAVLLGACAGTSDSETVTQGDMVDSGSWYARETWPHDGNPYESDHFVVYSDAASHDAREATAEMAEQVWAELLTRFDVQQDDLIFPTDRDRIDIYVYKNQDPQSWGMRAYQAGLISWSLDHPTRPTDVKHYEPVLRHELVHVLETLLKGRDSTIEPMTDAWFSEGLAEAVTGGTTGGRILGQDQLAALLDQHGQENPVSLKRDNWYVSDFNYHYPMFGLAVEYLLSQEGEGRSLTDARDVFADMAGGMTFEAAFDRHMGVPLDTYEAEFFERIDEYLPAYRNPLFSPLGIALLVVLLAGTAATVLIVSGRRNRSEGTTLAVAGHLTSTILGGLFAVGMTAGILIVFGTGGNLYNTSEVLGRHLASWMMVLYFLGSLALLVWTQQSWSRGSRFAFLGFPLVVLLLAPALLIADVLL